MSGTRFTFSLHVHGGIATAKVLCAVGWEWRPWEHGGEGAWVPMQVQSQLYDGLPHQYNALSQNIMQMFPHLTFTFDHVNLLEPGAQYHHVLPAPTTPPGPPPPLDSEECGGD